MDGKAACIEWRFEEGSVMPPGVAGSHGAKGQRRRQLSENLELSESKMHTARAMTSVGKSARTRSSWTRETDGVVRDAAGGMRLVR